MMLLAIERVLKKEGRSGDRQHGHGGADGDPGEGQRAGKGQNSLAGVWKKGRHDFVLRYLPPDDPAAVAQAPAWSVPIPLSA